MAKPIGTLGTIDTLTVGGRVFTDLTTIIVLGAWTSTNANATFRKPGGAAGYQVTTGKTLTVSALRISETSNSAATSHTAIAQSDNDVGLDSATALTNPIYYGGGSSVNNFNSQDGAGTFGAPGYFEYGGIQFPVAALKYLSVFSQSSGGHFTTAWGYEA